MKAPNIKTIQCIVCGCNINMWRIWINAHKNKSHCKNKWPLDNLDQGSYYKSEFTNIYLITATEKINFCSSPSSVHTNHQGILWLTKEYNH